MSATTAPPSIPGLHHVTAICGDPQENIDFYSGLLGLRMVKKTVNFDDPNSYHLYYGDGLGSPGTIMTFFAWTNLPPMAVGGGRAGTGQVTTVSFSIPETSLEYWIDRLAAAAIDFEGPYKRFDEQILAIDDPDGLNLALVTRPDIEPREPWHQGPVPIEHAIAGIHGVSPCLMGYAHTEKLLVEDLGFRKIAEEGSFGRFSVGAGRDETMLDIRVQPDEKRGRMGIGSVHHVAWRVPDLEQQAKWRSQLVEAGFDVTPVLDRQYFESIYFREPGGVLFEIATDEPGFTIDEDRDELGTHLKLPPWLESRRQSIEARLPQIRMVGRRDDHRPRPGSTPQAPGR